jgi:ribosomal protein L7/L12
MYTDQDIALLRDRIVHLEGQVAFLYRRLGVTFVPEVAPGDDPRIIAAIKKGNLLEAIKLYREVHSTTTMTVGLDEAKRAVEEIKGRLGI